MPKQKKAPKNAYYFFIMDKKKEYERNGTRFNGIRDLFGMENLREEWKELDLQVREKYDQLAKDAKAADKLDLTNKFTCAGESYAQVQERENQNKMEANLLEEILSIATGDGPGLNARSFVILKSIHMAEVGYPPNMEYWPAELAVAAFKLDTGYIISWWTLIDVVKLPTGYASAAKDTFDITCLPLPGSHKYQPKHREYFNILRNLKKFILQYVEPIKGYYIVFVKPEEGKLVDEGVLNWLLDHADYGNVGMREEYEEFVRSVKFIRVTKLLLKLAGVARERTPSYQPPVAVYGFLEAAAAHILSAGDWDFKENITCAYHNLDEARNMAQTCCRNIVLRTVFLILREVIRPMKIQAMSTHYTTCIKTMPPYEVPPPTAAPLPPRGEPVAFSSTLEAEWSDMSDSFVTPKMDFGLIDEDVSAPRGNGVGGGVSMSTYLNNAWGASSNPSSFTTDDFPALGSGGAARVAGRGMGVGQSGTAPPGFGPGNVPGGSGYANGNGNVRGRGGIGPGRGGTGNAASGGGWAFPDAVPRPGLINETHEDLAQDPFSNSWGRGGFQGQQRGNGHRGGRGGFRGA